MIGGLGTPMESLETRQPSSQKQVSPRQALIPSEPKEKAKDKAAKGTAKEATAAKGRDSGASRRQAKTFQNVKMISFFKIH